jgi:UDP-GlcNAc:undecaprenyl-phosphate GlcNAc-1-phosphate transferase
MTQQIIFFLIVTACGFISTFAIRSIAIKLDIVNKPNPIIPQHVKPVAYLGGVGIYGGLVLGLLVSYYFQNDLFNEIIQIFPVENSIFPGLKPVLGLVIGSTAYLVWGMYDDLKALEAFPKFIGQVFISIASVLMGIKTNMVGNYFIDFLFSSFWILFVVNALNFTDVCDGLVGSICCITFLVAGILLPGISTFCFLISASTFGFLFFNSPNASIFMGDAGSHLLGFLIAAMGILKNQSHSFIDASVWMVLFASLPVFELIFITTIRVSRGMPWWKGSPDHFSLRLQKGGFTRWQIDILSAMISAVVVSVACKYNILNTSLKISLPIIILVGYLVFANILMKWEVKK